MKDIKLKKKSNKIIKTINRISIVSERFKENIVQVKDKVNSNEENNLDYGNRSIEKGINFLSYKVLNHSVKISDKIINKSIKKITKSKRKIKQNKNKIKTVDKTAKAINKTTKESVKLSQRMIKATEKTIKATVKVIKETIKLTEKIIKAVIEGTKALIEVLAAGGWIAVVIIVVICMFAFLFASVFGIFFTNEVSTTKTMTSVVREVNQEVYSRTRLIKSVTLYDEYVVESSFSNWKEVIAIYTIKYSSDNNITYILDDKNVMYLKNIFWSMNTIRSELEQFNSENLLLKNRLHIYFESKSKELMMDELNFTEDMKKEVNDLLASEYDSLWNNLIYGSTDSSKLINIALEQVGNVGGEKYWRWYGFESRVEWCAVFVSWVANESGVLNMSIPRFSLVSDGVDWFKINGRWEEQNYLPKSGDIIFFDWENDGKPNHVGIVEKVENNMIYTIEGNSTNDECCQKEYDLLSEVIYGYGIN